MKQIPLTQGQVALVDDEDFEFLNQWKWCVDSVGYAGRNTLSQHRKFLRMHRIILNTPIGMQTDHINGNRLDNRRCNLRICTKSQNGMNRPKQVDNTSGYKGVFKNGKRWMALIKKDGKHIYLGTYNTKEVAAHAYDFAACKIFGEFAFTNFGEKP